MLSFLICRLVECSYTTAKIYEIPGDVKRETRDVKLIVHHILDREIKTLGNKKRLPEIYIVTFNAKSTAGGLPNGIYLYKLQYGNFIKIKKMILIK